MTLFFKEETFCTQRSRFIWLEEGYISTKIFHLSTMKHRAKNRISNLSRERDKITNENEISREIISYFSSLLSSDLDVDGTK